VPRVSVICQTGIQPSAWRPGQRQAPPFAPVRRSRSKCCGCSTCNPAKRLSSRSNDWLSSQRLLGEGFDDPVLDATKVSLLPESFVQAKAKRSAVRSAVEHAFAGEEAPHEAFLSDPRHRPCLDHYQHGKPAANIEQIDGLEGQGSPA